MARKGLGTASATVRTAKLPGRVRVRHGPDWRFMLHNREWSGDNVYRSVQFAVATAALPLEQLFWDDLLRNAPHWGMVVYEQDWLYTSSPV